LAASSKDLRAEKAEEFEVDTPLYTATFSNVGAVLKSYKLKAYADDKGHPLELIDQSAGSKVRSEEHTSELQSRSDLVCRLLLENTLATTAIYTLSLHDALPIFSGFE